MKPSASPSPETHPAPPSPADAIATYIRAKDLNRPHLMASAFSEQARLRMHVHTEAITFPAESLGRAAIADTLVRGFNQAWENVYTLCLDAPPPAGASAFSCTWMVVMSSRQDGSLRVGGGRYDWTFDLADHRVRALEITIAAMEVATCDIAPVMAWADRLPWPFLLEAVMGLGLGGALASVLALLHAQAPEHHGGAVLGLRLVVLNASAIALPLALGATSGLAGGVALLGAGLALGAAGLRPVARGR